MQTTTSTNNPTEMRALELLGAGVNPESVASALGVTVSRISQLMSQDDFKNEVIRLRYENLQKHNTRDNTYDSIEDKLLVQLERAIPLAIKPMEVTRILQVVNAAKRRGQSAPDSIIQQQTVVKLNMPTKIINQFSVQVNTNNQVVQAGDQELLTIQSGTLLKQIEGRNNDSVPAQKRIGESTS
jgi:hypothetical protein